MPNLFYHSKCYYFTDVMSIWQFLAKTKAKSRYYNNLKTSVPYEGPY